MSHPHKRTRARIQTVSMFLILPAAELAQATTVMVPAGNSSSLTSALKNAQPGETIILEGGTYTTGISTSVAGTAAAPITVEGENGATLSNTTGAGEGIEVNNNYYIFQNIAISGFQESFRTDAASFGIANNITASGSKIEAFKFKNTSQHWLIENCSVANSGMEGYYVGDASQNWSGGVPDQSGYITFYHDTNNVNVNDGFDCKEGSLNVRIVDCESNWNNTVPGANNEGDSGACVRNDNETVMNYTVLNNGSAGNAVRVQTSTVNGITYGSNCSIYGVVANNIQGSFLDTTQTGTKLYSNYSLTNVAGGLLESGSKTPSQPSPSTFVEPTWSGIDGAFLPINMVWNNIQSAVGDGSTWDYNQQNFDDSGVNGNIPVIFFQGVSVTFNDSNNAHYNVTLSGSVAPGLVTVNNSGGNYVFSGPGAIAGTAALTKSGFSTLTLDTMNTYSGGTSVSAGTLVAGVHGALPSGPVSIIGGTLQLATGTGLAQITALSISGSGTFDVTNNHAIINYGAGPDPIASIAALIAGGYNGGSWTGSGITSSAAQNNSGSYGIGYADFADPGNPAGLSSGQIEIMYTLLGDANLDGAVNGTDFAIMATNFNKADALGHSGWDEGDFNYDGSVNGADFAELASNFNKGASQADISSADISALDAFAASNSLGANVPEPISVGLLILGVTALLPHRHRRLAPLPAIKSLSQYRAH